MRKLSLQILVIVAGFIALQYLPIGLYQQANIFETTENSFDSTLKDETSGTGTYFELKDSDYLNVSLQSSETITVVLSSHPKMVSLTIPPSSVSSAQLTLGGLVPNTVYYLFDNSHKNETAFTPRPDGSYSWTQDLSMPHYVWVQEKEGTVFIPDDCDSVGSFDGSTSTCTLNQDVNDTIEITTDSITLDCSGHTISSSDIHGVLLVSRQGVTVENCSVNNSGTGIRTTFSNNNTFTNNTVSNNGGTGIAIGALSNFNTVSDSTVSGNRDGILINNAANNVVSNNAVQLNSLDGIVMVGSFADTGNNDFQDNIVSNNGDRGIAISGFVSQFNNFVNNTVSNNNAGIEISGFAANNKIFNNNFVNNIAQTAIASNAGPNLFDNGLPDGGNYWSDYDTPAEGCNDANNDKFCDAPRVISTTLDIKDNYPWTTRGGWKAPPDKVNVNLSWSQNEDPDFESYRIFRDTGAGVGLGDTLVSTITNQSQTSFTDPNLDADVIYFYKVFVFDKVGLVSGSNEQSVKP